MLLMRSGPAGAAFRRPATFGTPARGRGGQLGAAPSLAPSALPPEHPLKGASITAKLRGHTARAAGASFPRCVRSGDLPPRRVNARSGLRSGWIPFQPKITSNSLHWHGCVSHAQTIRSKLFLCNAIGKLHLCRVRSLNGLTKIAGSSSKAAIKSEPPARAQQGEHGRRSKCGFAAARIFLVTMYRKKSPRTAR